MPRGGKREGAGKPSSWESGCKFENTKLIRVPKAISDRVLELAHSLDEGVDHEIIAISLLEENEKLKEQLNQNKEDKNHQQLSLNFDSGFNEDDLMNYRDEALASLKVGQQYQGYKMAKKALDYFINKLNIKV